MPKIHFLSNPKIPHDMADEWKGYVKDSVHDVSSVEADRWVRRGVAEIVTARQASAIVKEVEEAPKEEVKKEEPPAVVNKGSLENVGTVSNLGTSTSSPSTPTAIPTSRRV